VQQVDAALGPERVRAGQSRDRGADRDGTGADDERVVIERFDGAVGGREGDGVAVSVDAACDRVESQSHSGGFEVRGGAVGEVAPVRHLAGDVVGDAADREVGVRVGEDDRELAAGGRVRVLVALR